MAKETREFKSFDDFTNLYEVQKTLRFELKPVPATEAVLRNKGVWYAEDEKKAKEKPIIRFYMDILHREFTKDALERITLESERFFKVFWNLKQSQNQAASTKEAKKLKQADIKDNRNKLNTELKELAKVFKKVFDQTDKDWKIKYREAGKVIKNLESDI